MSTAINTSAPVEFVLAVSVAPGDQRAAEVCDEVDECSRVESACHIEDADVALYVRTRAYAPQLARFLPRDR
jgi:hypothetical protein